MSLDPESRAPAVSNSNDDGPNVDAFDAGAEAGEFENEDEDRPRFCSLDPPSEVYNLGDVRSRGIATHAEFSEACHRGQLKQVKAMVEVGSLDLSEVDEDGKTVVHVAAGYRHCHEVLAYLLENGARFDKGDNVGAVPLHAAASSRNMAGVHQLLQFGAEVDVRENNGCTPLFAACEAKAHRVIVELLEGGANPTLVGGKDSLTPLHALLHASKASSKSSRAKIGASTPGAFGLRETVDLMVKAGASLMAVDGSGQSVVDAAASFDAELVHHMLTGCNLAPVDALVHAIKHGDTLAATELLNDGKVEPCTVIDDNGRSLLHVAAAHGRLEGTQLLLTGQWLQREDTVPLNIDARDKIGRTALFHATLNAFLDVAAFLLDAGASPAIQDGSGAGVGYTFADTVVAEQKTAVCELLAKWGSRSGEERERAESSMSKKAPGGDVVFFSGVVPYVHGSKTKHLWAPVNALPPPAEAAARHVSNCLGAGGERQEVGANPWRGKMVDADSFQDINHSCRQDLPSPTSQGAADRHGSSEVEEAGMGQGLGRNGPRGEAVKYVADDSTPRRRRGKSLEMDGKGMTSTERESRMASEPGTSAGNATARKAVASRKGRPRRRGSVSRRQRGCSDASSGQGDDKESPERRRGQSAAAGSTVEERPGRSTTADLGRNDPPKNQHRKLRPRAMDEQAGLAKASVSAPEVMAGAAGEPSTSVHSPSAPTKSISSRTLLKTFW